MTVVQWGNLQPAVTMVAIIWFYLLCMSTGLADKYRYEAWKSHDSRTTFELLQLVLLVVWTENRPWLQTQFAVQPAILQLASSSNAVRTRALNVVSNARLDLRHSKPPWLSNKLMLRGFHANRIEVVVCWHIRMRLFFSSCRSESTSSDHTAVISCLPSSWDQILIRMIIHSCRIHTNHVYRRYWKKTQ